jgi:hypothetical protein
VLHAHVVELETYLEGTLQHTAVGHILELGIHHGVALARLTVLKVNTLPDTTIHADAGSDFDFL